MDSVEMVFAWCCPLKVRGSVVVLVSVDVVYPSVSRGWLRMKGACDEGMDAGGFAFRCTCP
jgi:hypothetical protein